MNLSPILTRVTSMPRSLTKRSLSVRLNRNRHSNRRTRFYLHRFLPAGGKLHILLWGLRYNPRSPWWLISTCHVWVGSVRSLHCNANVLSSHGAADDIALPYSGRTDGFQKTTRQIARVEGGTYCDGRTNRWSFFPVKSQRSFTYSIFLIDQTDTVIFSGDLK